MVRSGSAPARIANNLFMYAFGCCTHKSERPRIGLSLVAGRNYNTVSTLVWFCWHFFVCSFDFRWYVVVNRSFVPKIRYTSNRNLALNSLPFYVSTDCGTPHVNAQWVVNALEMSNAVTHLTVSVFTNLVKRLTMTSKHLFLRRVDVSSPSNSMEISSILPEGGRNFRGVALTCSRTRSFYHTAHKCFVL